MFAALDIGTNSIKVLVAAPDGRGGLREQAEFCRTTRLGEGVDRTGRLQPAAMARTLAAMADLVASARAAAPACTGVAVATSAVRDAANGTEFLEACARLLGRAPQLITGDEEADTVFGGATSDQATGRACICIDIGGGSTELAAGRPERCEVRTSLALGCVRLGERFALLAAADAAAGAAARAAAATILAPACSGIAEWRGSTATPVRLLVSGGTAATLGAICAGVAVSERERIHGLQCTEPDVTAWAERLLPLAPEVRAQTPGLPRERAAVLPAGLLILSEAMRGLRVTAVTITTRGLRFGLVLRLFHRELEPTWIW